VEGSAEVKRSWFVQGYLLLLLFVALTLAPWFIPGVGVIPAILIDGITIGYIMDAVYYLKREGWWPR
jgi:hypothetical protein